MWNNYYSVETPEFEQLENGDYKVQILKAENKSYSNGNEFCEVTVRIKDHDNCRPNTIVLNEAPILGAMKANGQQVTKEDVDKANNRITRFFQAFNIHDGDFNYANWRGKVGFVHCAEAYDASEPDKKSKKYKQLTAIIPRNQKQAAELTKKTPEKVETVAKTFKAEEVKKDNVFPEDISF